MQARADEQQHRAEARAGGAASRAAPAGGQNEGWGAYMSRQLNERTEQLGLAGDSMDKLGENSAGWADDVGKYVQKQKRNMVLGGKSSQIPEMDHLQSY